MGRIRTLALTKLSEERREEIRALEAICRRYDGTEAAAELSNEMNFSRRLRCFFLYLEDNTITGYLEVFCPDGKTAEISAFVDPERRRQGIFGALMEMAGVELADHGVKNTYLVAEPASKDAAAVLRAMGLEREYSELVMGYRGQTMSPALGPAKTKEPSPCPGLTCRKDENGLVYLLSEGEETIGSAGVYAGENELFIYGVEIKENYRGKGHGTDLTWRMLEDLEARYPGRHIRLQVRSDNKHALHIYEKCGFVTESERMYYPVKQRREKLAGGGSRSEEQN